MKKSKFFFGKLFVFLLLLLLSSLLLLVNLLFLDVVECLGVGLLA